MISPMFIVSKINRSVLNVKSFWRRGNYCLLLVIIHNYSSKYFIIQNNLTDYKNPTLLSKGSECEAVTVRFDDGDIVESLHVVNVDVLVLLFFTGETFCCSSSSK